MESIDKVLAAKILLINIEEKRVVNEKYEIMKRLNFMKWDDVCTAAMKFLLDAPSGK